MPENRSLAMFVARRCHSKVYNGTNTTLALLHVATVYVQFLHVATVYSLHEQFCKVLKLERCGLSASLGVFVRDTKGLSMVAGEWRAVTLASEGWPGLVSPQPAALQSCQLD